jgi:RimJ/RimL family protein N-acetyltransferase
MDAFDPQPQLVGELVELRPLRADDFDALRAAAADPLIWAQHPADRHLEEEFRAYFDEQLASRGGLVIVDRADGRIVGSTRFHGFDAERSEVEIGWTFLARSHWGGAVNGEVKRLLLAHAFRSVETVVFLVHGGNARSRRAVEKLGAVESGERRGMVLYALPRRLWAKRVTKSPLP